METLYARTADGWDLALHYTPADAGTPRRRHPLILLHGLGVNRLNVDLDERHSITRFARSRGFATYVLELRGVGMSRWPQAEAEAPSDWGFSEYLTYDMPAAAQAVLEHSGADSFHGLGHSMGGMAFYALGTQRHPALRSITAIGSPFLRKLRLAPQERRLLRLATRMSRKPRLGALQLPVRRLMSAAGRFAPITHHIVNGLLLNSNNTEPSVMSRMAMEAITDVPVRLIWELTHQMAGRDVPAYAWEEELDRINVPVFAVAGTADRVAAPESVSEAVRRLRGPDIRYREMGRRYGERDDYGHADLLVGRDAPEEVFPLLVDFLEEVD